MVLRTCIDCGLEAHTDEELEGFVSDKGAKYSRKAICKSCHNSSAVVYRIENKEKIAEYKKDNKEKLTAYIKEHYKNNKEAENLRAKEYRKNNKDSISLKHKEYYRLHPEVVRGYNRKRRAKKLEVEENYTKEDSEYTYKLFNDSCFNCSSTENLCVDHHNPLSKGYALTRTNAVILCKSCNSSKGNKMPEGFYAEDKLTVLEEMLCL